MNATSVPPQQSVRRAVDVLFCFRPHEHALSAGEAASRLGMNRTTVWRYLRTLAATGLVRDLGEGRFALGPRTVSLAETYTAQWGELGVVAAGALVQLRDTVGETAALHLRQGWARVVVRQVESRHELHRTYRDLGEPISLLAGAPSRAILAALAPSEQAAVLEAHLEPDTPEREQVELDLARIRACGFAHSRGARVPDVTSVAAPLHGPDAEVLGAVNITGPMHRVPEDAVQRIATEVRSAAAWIETQLGSTPAHQGDTWLSS